MKNISNQAVEQIKKEQIKPISRKVFVVKSLLRWLGILLAVMFGALSFAIATFLVKDLDWDVYGHLGHGFVEFLIISIPHLWIIFIVIFVLISYRNFRSTENGYKQRGFLLLGVILGVSVVFGYVLYVVGVGEYFNEAFSESIPGYSSIIQTKEKQWSQPENGLLAGEVIGVGEDEFSLRDFGGSDWVINTDKDVIIRGGVLIEDGEVLKVVGEQDGEDAFDAEEIRPWEGNGKMRRDYGSDAKSRGQRAEQSAGQGARKGK